MEAFLMEGSGGKVVIQGDATSAQTGARVSMKMAKRCTFLVALGTSTGATVTVSLQQHNAATGGTSKALAITNPYFFKAGASTAMTKVEPTSAQDTYALSATYAAASGLLSFEVLEEDLDTNGGFTHISLNLAAATVTKSVTVIAILRGIGGPAYSIDL